MLRLLQHTLLKAHIGAFGEQFHQKVSDIFTLLIGRNDTLHNACKFFACPFDSIQERVSTPYKKSCVPKELPTFIKNFGKFIGWLLCKTLHLVNVRLAIHFLSHLNVTERNLRTRRLCPHRQQHRIVAHKVQTSHHIFLESFVISNVLVRGTHNQSPFRTSPLHFQSSPRHSRNSVPAHGFHQHILIFNARNLLYH